MHALVGVPNKGTLNDGYFYAYTLDGTQVSINQAPGSAAADNFGFSIAYGSGYVLVGAPGDDDYGSASGAAHLFTDYPFNHYLKFTPSDGAAGDFFGYSVGIGSGMFAVGAPFDTPQFSSKTGSVYIYKLNNLSGFYRKITPSNGQVDDLFGWSVAVGCGRVVVGAPSDDDNGTASGSVYIYSKHGNEIKMITAPDGAALANFGHSVAVGSGFIVVGAPYANSDAGRAYLYDLNGNLLKTLNATDTNSAQYFGWSVAVGSGRVVIGAPLGDAGFDTNCGKTYVFDLNGKLISILTSPNQDSDLEFGTAVAIGPGRILASEPFYTGGVSNAGAGYLYQTPLVYTPYDVAEFNSRLG